MPDHGLPAPRLLLGCAPNEAQTMILNGQVPHLAGFTRAVFAPGNEVELHWHKSKDEVFYAAEGKGVIEVDGTVVQVIG